VKQIRLSGVPTEHDRYIRSEVNILKRLHHPGVVRFFDSYLDEAAQVLSIITELCEYGDVLRHASTFPLKKLPWNDAVQLAWTLLEILYYLHLDGVMHRDIKVR